MKSSCWTSRAIPSIWILVRKGELTPMFFGSAITNFGVEPFLTRFLEYSTPPALARDATCGPVEPADDPDFSGFIFKIQANMNPAHRDRLAFMRICSGVFDQGHDRLAQRHGQDDSAQAAAAVHGARARGR